MITKKFPVFLLVTLVGSIYILRFLQVSSSSHLTLRKLQAQTSVNEPVCDGVTIEPVSQSDRDDANDIRGDIKDLREENELIEFIEGPAPKDEFDSDYIGPLIGKAAPWIALFGVGVILFLLSLIFWSCSYCRTVYAYRKGKAKKLGRKGKIICYVLSVLFLLCLLGSSAAALTFTIQGFRAGERQAVCAFTMIGYQIQNGDLPENWIGVNNFTEKVLASIQAIPSTVQNLSYPTAQEDIAAVNTAFDGASSSVDTLYEDNEGQTVDRADFTIGGTYQPTYIEDLGPETNSSTESGIILREMEIKTNAITNISATIAGSIAVLQQIASNPDSGALLQRIAQVVVAAANSVNDFVTQFQDYARDVRDVLDSISKGLIGVLSANIGITVIALLSILLFSLGLKWIRKIIHFSWCFIGLLMVFAWVLSTIVFMMTILAGEACEAAERFVTDQNFFNQVLAKFFPGAEYTVGKQLLSNCLFGDGDVLTALEAREPFEPYEGMFTALDNTTSLNESIQSAPGSITIPPQQFLVSQLQTGLISDSPETNTDLLSLNSFTNRRTNPCTEMQDTWVLNSANCTEEMGAIFTANSVAGFNIGNPTCIGFNIWGNRQIEERYNVETFPPICDEIGGMEADIGLGNFVNSFVVNRNQVENVFENVQVDLTAVSNANANLMNTITTTAANIASVREQTAGLYQLLGDRTTGVLRNSFCGFIKTSYAVFEDMLCVNFVTGVYRTMITVIITSFFGVFAMLALCCLSRRLLKENKLAKMVKNAGRQGIV